MPVTVPRRNKTPQLPTDIILHHILPRLPAKSVIRLTTVSKEFHSFLKTHQFAKMHAHHVTNNPRHKFLVLSIEQGSQRRLFSSIDHETQTTAAGSLIPSPSRPVPFLTDRFPYMRVLTSFHGLLCVGILNLCQQEYSDLILWNPAIGDYKILSKDNVVINCSRCLFGLYYSCCDDDYKLLHINRQCEVYMYSLRFDSWRKLVVGRLERHLCSPESVWLNENLYFLGGSFDSIIMRFDTITENITVMRLPLECPVEDVCKSLFVHQGYIHLCVRFFDGNYKIVKYDTWRMNGDGNWSMVDTYNMDKTSFARRLKRRPDLMKNGEWLMIHDDKDGTHRILYMFDPEKKAYTYTHLRVNRLIPEGRYTETLVSPNQYN